MTGQGESGGCRKQGRGGNKGVSEKRGEGVVAWMIFFIVYRAAPGVAMSASASETIRFSLGAVILSDMIQRIWNRSRKKEASVEECMGPQQGTRLYPLMMAALCSLGSMTYDSSLLV
jgi:hypothetical protein